MKTNQFLLVFFIMQFIFSCDKEKNIDNHISSSEITHLPIDTCANPSSKGRIIGFNPYMSFDNFDTSRFVKYDSSLGPGYLIEIDNGTTKDTVITYRIKTNNFQFNPSFQKIDSRYLFKSDYQDSLKIKFNYKILSNKTEVYIFSLDNTPMVGLWLAYIKNKSEIAMSCVTQQ